MKQCAILIAAIGFITGCAHNTGSSARYESGAVGITPLESSSPDSRSRSHAVANREDLGQPISARREAQGGEFTEIPLYREELQVGKRQVSKGSVVIRKIVNTQTTNIPVQLRREEIVVERIQPDGERRVENIRGDVQPFQEREVVVELNREVPVVEKNTQVSEVLRARKTVDTRQQQIVDTVRSENVDIDRQVANNEAPARRENEAAGAPPQNVSERAQSERADNAEIVLHREQLQVGTREVPSGRVVLRKNIQSQEVSQPVELRSEDVKIERAPAGENRSHANAFQSREIVIPLFEEVPVKEKELHLAEVIRIGKRTESEQENITGQIRHEQVEVARNDRDRNETAIETEAQGGPAPTESGRAESSVETKSEGREKFSGEITKVDLDNRRVTVRNREGQERTFTLTERSTLTIKENRAPSLWNFKPGYNVTVGHRGDSADLMILSDAPEVR